MLTNRGKEREREREEPKRIRQTTINTKNSRSPRESPDEKGQKSEGKAPTRTRIRLQKKNIQSSDNATNG